MRGAEIRPERYEDMIVCLGWWSGLTGRLMTYLPTLQPVHLPTLVPKLPSKYIHKFVSTVGIPPKKKQTTSPLGHPNFFTSELIIAGPSGCAI
jgi:hypothetical protein